jgi:hypothetical protein
MSVAYLVRMIQGNDTCTTVTSVEANNHEEAAFNAQMKWTGITIKIVNVELAGECFTDTCENDDHWCTTDERHGHLETDGTCMNCHY